MTQVPEWMFGPAGDLRPLPNPTPGVSATLERFGGTHVAISGSRTVDTFGHKSNYSFTLGNLLPEEVSWLEMMAMARTGRELYLLDPMRPNMLDRYYASGLRTSGNNSTRGFTTFTDPAAAPAAWLPGFVAVSSLSNTSDAFLSSDGAMVPMNNQPFTVSAFYQTSTSDLQVYHNVQYFDANQAAIIQNSGPLQTVPTGGWVRLSSTLTPPAGAAYGRVRFSVASQGESYASSVSVNIAGLQANMGSTLAQTSSGGGAIRCVVDSFDVDSPRYPLQNVSMTLMEV